MMVKFILFTLFILSIVTTGVVALCPEGAYLWQSDCYIFQTNSTGFADAESNCAPLGGHLVSIHDGFTNALLAQKGTTYFHNSNNVTDIWIGLTNLITIGNWTWMDGTNVDFMEWTTGEPQNVTGPFCASMSLIDGRWIAEDCFKLKPYVCKISESTLTTTVPVTQRITTAKYANCSNAYIYFEGSCYLFRPDNPVDWLTAEQICQENDGKLVSIHTITEQLFLEKFDTSGNFYFWTGAYSDDGIIWKWYDGTPWDYNPWKSGSPTLRRPACAELKSVGIDDYPCSRHNGVICKKKLGLKNKKYLRVSICPEILSILFFIHLIVSIFP